MLNISKSQVSLNPFPHVISDELLAPEIYTGLRADYPTAEIFEGQKKSSGKQGSRTGQGFDIYRGDESYDRLMTSSQAWRSFNNYINSTQFVDKFLELFGDQLDALDCTAEIASNNYMPEYIEGRDLLTEKPTLNERVVGLTRRILPHSKTKKAVNLFTRLDIHKALEGYGKTVHCDRPNRLCSLIVYFCDAEKAGLKGGNLTIHAHREQKPVSEYERHPKVEDAPVFATLRPKENLGVFFPCCNNSYHGVTPVETQGAERDYLYINISVAENACW